MSETTKTLKLEIDTTDLNEQQVRLIKSVHSLLTHIMSAEFEDEYFERKINYLLGYTKEPELTISEGSILDFHLAHRTNPDFNFEPKKNTNPKFLFEGILLFFSIIF